MKTVILFIQAVLSLPVLFIGAVAGFTYGLLREGWLTGLVEVEDLSRRVDEAVLGHNLEKR